MTPQKEEINPKLLEKCEYGVERRLAAQHAYCASCEHLGIGGIDSYRTCGFWRSKT